MFLCQRFNQTMTSLRIEHYPTRLCLALSLAFDAWKHFVVTHSKAMSKRELGRLTTTGTWTVFAITLQILLTAACISLGLDETRKCTRYAVSVHPKRSTTRLAEHMKRLLLYRLNYLLTWQPEVVGELYIKNINHAKPRLRVHAAEIQPASDQGLIPIISVGVPQERERSILSQPCGVRITTDLLL